MLLLTYLLTYYRPQLFITCRKIPGFCTDATVIILLDDGDREIWISCQSWPWPDDLYTQTWLFWRRYCITKTLPHRFYGW